MSAFSYGGSDDAPPDDWQVILCSHAGRPKGEVVESMRIGNIGGCLGELLDEPVACPADCIGDKVEEQVRPIPLLHACACIFSNT